MVGMKISKVSLTLLIASLLVSILFLLIGCQPTKPVEPFYGNHIKIYDYRIGYEEYGDYFEGKAKNITSKTLSYCEVVVYFYKNDIRVDEGIDNVSDLRPSEIFYFKVQSFKDCDRVKFGEGDCWY